MTALFITLGFLLPLSLLYAIVMIVIRSTRRDENEKNKMLTPVEVAVETSMFIALVTSIVSFASIIFAAIDKKYPDVLATNYYAYDSSVTTNDDVRVAVSVILVMFPIYLALAWYRSFALAKSNRSEVAAFKYQHYVTLFVSAVFLVGSLIAIIYSYMGGGIIGATVYKSLTVLVLALLLGAYHYFSLMRAYKEKTYLPIVFTVISLLLVIGGVVYAVTILGTPTQVRATRYDDKRMTDLSNIQQNVLNSWITKKNLPENLSVLSSDGISSGFIVPTDPKTKDPYTYKVITDSKMVRTVGKDCATFYPSKYQINPTNAIYETSKLVCEIPSKAVFEICANFETKRVYDENGMDQSANGAFDTASPVMSKYGSDIAYYNGSYDKTPNWNHDIGNTCFTRTIDPLKYPSY